MLKKNQISYREYKRRVFNECLLECLCGLHYLTLVEKGSPRKRCDELNENFNYSMGVGMTRAYCNEELNLGRATITETKNRLCGKNSFIDDIVNICEAVAETKAQDAEEEKLELPDALTVELSEEDQALIDKVFDEKPPENELEAIRDATVDALVAENKKAEEIKNALDIAQASAADNANGSKSIEEAVNRISAKGPTSLMNAILTRISSEAAKEVISESGGKPISEIMHDNKETIKDRAIMMYNLYEMAHVFGIHEMKNKAEVEMLAKQIYNGK